MRPLFFAVLFAVSLLSCGAFAQPDNSVAGLKAGMSLDEITAKLGSDYLKATTAVIEQGQVVSFTKGMEGYNVLLMGGKAVYIEHQQFFDPKAPIATDELPKDLAEKYGPPSTHSDDDKTEAWIIVDGKTLTGAALTDPMRACTGYETQGPFFRPMSDKLNFAFSFPKVPVQPQLADCGLVIQAKPTPVTENPGLTSHLTVTVFDIKAAQAWYDAALADYNKALKDAVDAARKNKPSL